MKDIKILIAIPNLEGPKAENSACITSYWGNHKYPSVIHYINDTYIHMARNRAMVMAADLKATHLMFIDSDMTFPAWGVDRLVEQNKDIIGGLYFGRRTPLPVVLKVNNDTNKLEIYKDIPTFDKPYETDAVGTGFMLIKTEAFARIEPPFFAYSNPKEFELTPNPFPGNEVGEDVYFCLKARKAGLKVWVDPTIPMGHVGRKIYTRTDYEAFHNKGLTDIYAERLF